MKELWKNIEGYSDYKISSFGRVKKKNGLIMKLQTTNGYLTCMLRKEGKGKRLYIHRLVALHFVNPKKGKTVINHIDKDRKNNYFENLDWVTQKENLHHLDCQELINNSKKKKVARLDENDKIVKIYLSVKDTEKDGFSKSSVSEVCRGKIKRTKKVKFKFL